MALSNLTKQVRRQFRENYSTTTANIIQRIARGQSSHVIADALGVSVPTVVTTRGNLTRGSYFPFADVSSSGTVAGTCQF